MRHFISKINPSFVAIAFICGLYPAMVQAQATDVCSTGLGIPPFLDAGADPNLLLAIDNSGSMLDMAYPSEDGSQCFDNNFNPAKEYAGNFDSGTWVMNSSTGIRELTENTWYVWDLSPKSLSTDPYYDETTNVIANYNQYGPYLPWRNGILYDEGQRVYTDGIIYSTSVACTSNADFLIEDDLSCNWEKLVEYNASTWEPTGYDNTDGSTVIVSYQGNLYQLKDNTTAGELDSPEDDAKWQFLYVGEFIKTDVDDIETCDLGAGAANGTTNYYESADGVHALCITVDNDKDPAEVTRFVASGNFLNWASASKFDVEKKILTGGKFDDVNNRLVSEGRGCSGNGYAKQVELADNGGYLVLRTRGSNASAGSPITWDKLDEQDDVTRIEILGISSSAINFDVCQEAVEKILKNDLRGSSHLIDLCLQPLDPEVAEDKFLADQRAALNQMLHYCWQDNPSLFNIYGDAGAGKGTCTWLFSEYDVDPNEISPYQSAYHCYGIYNPTQYHSDRYGYAGRCWDPGGGTSSGGDPDPQCLPRTALSLSEGGCDDTDGDGCTYCIEVDGDGVCTELYMNEVGQNYICTSIENDGSCKTQQQDVPGSRKYWNLVYNWYDTVPPGGYTGRKEVQVIPLTDPIEYEYVTCDPGTEAGCVANCLQGNSWNPDGDPTEIVTAGWSGDVDGEFGFDIADPPADDITSMPYPDRPAGDDPYAFKKPLESGAEYLCIWQAMEDYCADMSTPQVLDPSEDAGVTTEFGNLPANLIDSGVLSQLGVEHPLLVMKGFINQLEAPAGILQNNSDGIRMGVMAFHETGSYTECFNMAPTDNVDAYCSSNQDDDKDGGKLLVQMDSAEKEYGTNGPKHVDLVARAINATRAESWTPLAEMMYTALGYFTQNDALCINSTTSGTTTTCDDFKVPELDANGDPKLDGSGNEILVLADDPIEYWCQENNIIVITEGESTADVHASVSASVLNNMSGKFLTTPRGENDPNGEDDISGDEGDGTSLDIAVTESCPALIGSTYFDDMTWWGQNVGPLYEVRQLGPDNNNLEDKRNISTHVVTTSLLDDTASDVSAECNPTELMSQAAENGGESLYEGDGDPSTLEQNLLAALYAIKNRVSSGSAASVVSSSRSGEGAVYQAVFWPEIERPNEQDPLVWTGDVHSLFIDDYGRMWDDYDGDGYLDNEGDQPCDSEDRRLWYSFVDNKTYVCFTDPKDDPYCPPDPGCEARTTRVLLPIFDSYLWSTAQQLQTIDSSNILINRDVDSSGRWSWGTDYDVNRRYIFTWNDLNNNGIVDNDVNGTINEIIELEGQESYLTPIGTHWETAYPVTNEVHHRILDDFRVSDSAEMDHFIDWFRGSDNWYEPAGDDINGNEIQDYRYRCRRWPDCVPPDDAAVDDNPERRLGDVITSTPKMVAMPAEAFQNIYRDPSYAHFIERYKYRRNMIYFGGNDGMLHAVNAGYPVITDTEKRFARGMTRNPARGYLPDYNDDGPPLGHEMWAYLPYNLQAHVKCLSEPSYGEGTDHKYFIDKEPRIFDMRIFEEETECDDSDATTVDDYFNEDCIHPQGWGTILVGSMRFGGAQIDVSEEDGWPDTDTRTFISSYFILDITDPERPPRLLGEMTMDTESSVPMSFSEWLADEAAPVVDSTDQVILTDGAGVIYYTYKGNDQFFTNFAGQFINKDGAAIYEPDGATRVVDEDNNPIVDCIAEETLCYRVKIPMTQSDIADFGFSTPMPAGVVMKGLNGSVVEDFWYLLVGNGPETLEGTNNQQGKIGVLPMSWLDGRRGGTEELIPATRKAFRIPNAEPESGNFDAGGTLLVPEFNDDGDELLTSSIKSFTSDLITVDLDLRTETSSEGGLYKSDAVYFGTTDGTGFDPTDPETAKWDGGGRVMRLVTRPLPDTNGKIEGNEIDGIIFPRSTAPSEWEFKQLMDVEEPVTGAVSLGWDGANFWVYFGSGRFFSKLDKPDDSTNYFFGVKEPLFDNCEMSWDEISWDGTQSIDIINPGAGNPGSQGLIRTDYVEVFLNDMNLPDSSFSIPNAEGVEESVIFCGDPDLAENPAYEFDQTLEEYITDLDYYCDLSFLGNLDASYSGKKSFSELKDFIAGDSRGAFGAPDACNFDRGESETDPYYIGVDGWFQVLRGGEFNEEQNARLISKGERVLGQSTLLGGLVTFTGYQPFNYVCTPEGNSYLYGVHYQTGTAWYENVFGTSDGYSVTVDGEERQVPIVNERYELGRGLATTPSLHTGDTDDGPDAKAIIQTSTGAIVEIPQENLPIKPPQSGLLLWSDRAE